MDEREPPRGVHRPLPPPPHPTRGALVDLQPACNQLPDWDYALRRQREGSVPASRQPATLTAPRGCRNRAP